MFSTWIIPESPSPNPPAPVAPRLVGTYPSEGGAVRAAEAGGHGKGCYYALRGAEWTTDPAKFISKTDVR